MKSKNLSKRLEKLHYTLEKDTFGWVVVSTLTGFRWAFPTLEGVNRFVVDEEGMNVMITR